MGYRVGGVCQASSDVFVRQTGISIQEFTSGRALRKLSQQQFDRYPSASNYRFA
jgi:hypothetical protein